MARSLVLITVDCLRADHVGFLGYCHNTTPFLDTLAQSSTVFSNAIVAGAPNTIHSQQSWHRGTLSRWGVM